MYLVDTSVWIDYFRNRPTQSTQILRDLLLSRADIGLNAHIYMEILQGIKLATKRTRYKQRLRAHTLYPFAHPRKSYEFAAEIYSQCRQNGITIRSSIDCLIAQNAIENDLILLHNDKDFVQIASIIPALNQQFTRA